MSKSKGNVVDPDEIIRKYGADTARLFILFASPPDKDLDWSDSGVEGANRFLHRVWRLVDDRLQEIRGAGEPVRMGGIAAKDRRDLKRKIHFTIDRVTKDIEGERQFNTAVARLMELTNALGAFRPADGTDWSLFREGVETLILCLAPFTPHFCEELWERIGHQGGLVRESWPVADPEALSAETVVVVLQINGKVREQMELPAGLSREELLARVLADPRTAKRIEGKTLVKSVAVPDKLVNLVVRE